MSLLYVDNGVYSGAPGSNGNSGASRASQLRTLVYALTIAAPGDTIFLAGAGNGDYTAARYSEAYIDQGSGYTIPSGTDAANRVTIQAYPGEAVSLTANGNYNCIALTTAEWTYWKDLHLEMSDALYTPGNTTQAIALPTTVSEPDRNNRFENIEIHGSNTIAIKGDGIIGGAGNTFINIKIHDCTEHGWYLNRNNNTIDGCDIYNNGRVGGGPGAASPGHGMQVYSSGGDPTGNVIKNCRFYGNLIQGIEIQGTGTRVENCMCFYNAGAGIAVRVKSNVEIYNCALYANTESGIDFVSGSGHTAKNNISYGHVSPYSDIADVTSATKTNNLTGTDPGWVDILTGDFNLTSGASPAVAYGTPISGLTLDAAGRTRDPITPSAGPYEFGSLVTASQEWVGDILIKICEDIDFAVGAENFITLHTANPGLTGANELAAGWYAPFSMGHSDWNAASNRRISNSATVSWAALSLVTITHAGIRNYNGDFIKGFALNTPQTIPTGGNIIFHPGDLVIYFGLSFYTPFLASAGPSAYLADKVLDYWLRGVSFSVAPVYASLHTGNPGSTGANEVSGGSYIRQVAGIVDWASSILVLDSGYLIDLLYNNDLAWTDLPTCRVSHSGLWDADTGGNFLDGGYGWADPAGLTQFLDVFAGDDVLLDAGDLHAALTLN